MEEYLLGHNVTMCDFWILLALWVLDFLCIIYLWWKTQRMANRKCKYDGGMTYSTTILCTIVSVPLLLMGAWHFINMVLTLLFGFDLYIN